MPNHCSWVMEDEHDEKQHWQDCDEEHMMGSSTVSSVAPVG
jgi:hypothetical protein